MADERTPVKLYEWAGTTTSPVIGPFVRPTNVRGLALLYETTSASDGTMATKIGTPAPISGDIVAFPKNGTAANMATKPDGVWIYHPDGGLIADYHGTAILEVIPAVIPHVIKGFITIAGSTGVTGSLYAIWLD